jgi:lauroyl/myristoyl acyltransferase
MTDTERAQVVQCSLRNFWLEIFSWRPSVAYEARLRTAHVEGLEHLDRALETGRGAILWESNGFGARMAAKQVLHRRGYGLHQIHGHQHLGGFLTDDATRTWTRRKVRRIFLGWEGRFMRGAFTIPERASPAFGRTLLRLLADNGVMCVAGDGKEGQHRLGVTFLRHSITFSTGMLTLARMSGAAILPLFGWRDADGGVRVVVCPPLPATTLDRGRERRECLEQYAALLESHIRRDPGQYRNWHLLQEGPVTD